MRLGNHARPLNTCKKNQGVEKQGRRFLDGTRKRCGRKGEILPVRGVVRPMGVEDEVGPGHLGDGVDGKCTWHHPSRRVDLHQCMGACGWTWDVVPRSVTRFLNADRGHLLPASRRFGRSWSQRPGPLVQPTSGRAGSTLMHRQRSRRVPCSIQRR